MEPVELGTRRELFVDEYLIDRMDGVRLALQHPERREIAFEATAAWEDNTCGYHSLVQDGDVVRLYYRAALPALPDEDTRAFAVAESTDGDYLAAHAAWDLRSEAAHDDHDVCEVLGLVRDDSAHQGEGAVTILAADRCPSHPAARSEPALIARLRLAPKTSPPIG